MDPSVQSRLTRLIQSYEESGNELTDDPTNQEILACFGSLCPPTPQDYYGPGSRRVFLKT